LAGALERWRKANCRLPFGARLFSAYFHFQFAADYYPRGGCESATLSFSRTPLRRARSVPTLSNKINAFPQRKSFEPPIITLISTACSLRSGQFRGQEFTQKGWIRRRFIAFSCFSTERFDV
jgi:hypothetical protein